MTKEDKSYFEETSPSGEPSDGQIQKRPPVRYANGIVYEGQWKG